MARGKIYLAKNRGEPIPETWALSPDGAPTTDAAEGVLGVILPMAGHKGYAITLPHGRALRRADRQRRRHRRARPVRARRAPAAAVTCSSPSTRPRSATAPGTRSGSSGSSSEVKDVPLAQGFDEVFYPGEVEDRAEAATLAAGGIVLAEQSLADLRAPGHGDRRAVPGRGGR